MSWDNVESEETASPNILEAQTEQQNLVNPHVSGEGKIDFNKLYVALSGSVDRVAP